MKTLRNSVRLIGDLGLGPEVKETTNGKKMVGYSLATSETYRNKHGGKNTDTSK